MENKIKDKLVDELLNARSTISNLECELNVETESVDVERLARDLQGIARVILDLTWQYRILKAAYASKGV